MQPSSMRRSRYNSRPFVLSILVITLLTTYSFFAKDTSSLEHGLGKRDEAGAEIQKDCRAVHHAADQCAFIKANCLDDEAGLLSYMTMYYCDLGKVKALAFLLLVMWLALLFTTIGIAASDFFSVNLSTISSVLGLSESLAGVTFLALGNGSPDVFSTFAAMKSNSGSMAVGELIGAAGFITAVVAGSMALVREFKVSRKTLVRDICFFIAAIGFSMVFLADGELHLWECISMIGFYVFYVIVVVTWHWMTSRRRRQMKDATARAHQQPASGPDTDELEPYRDDLHDGAAPVGLRSDGAPGNMDSSALEHGMPPRIEVDGVGIAPFSADDEQRDLHNVAEVTSSMRVNRPRWRRSTTTISPIRPSLVGVLEFRSVLASLQREKNAHVHPLPTRTMTDSGHRRSQSAECWGQSGPSFPASRSRLCHHALPSALGSRAGQSLDRTLSQGHKPLNLKNENLVDLEAEASRSDSTQHDPKPQAISRVSTLDGRLAPPVGSRPPRGNAADQLTEHACQPSPLRIPPPDGRDSAPSTPSLSPFPSLSESPGMMTPISHAQEPSSYMFPTASERRQSSASELEPCMPVRWWPYELLPPPHVVGAILFPTLQGWKEKSGWDRLVSLLSVPSVFVLTMTLPVVETDSCEDDSDLSVVEAPDLGQPGNMAVPASTVGDSTLEAESEWQEYRRRARSMGSSTTSLRQIMTSARQSSAGDVQDERQLKPASECAPADDATFDDETLGWNRWLVALQILIGPLFVCLILWANLAEDFDEPGKTLARMILYSLLFSLCLLAVLLLTTSPDSRPKYHFLLCFLGFVISIAWISTVAGEVVGVLKAFGVILGISEAILGLTVFAVGNSIGDLVADVTVARLGYPVMALAACFGGPMLNILLGIGLAGAYMVVQKANKSHKRHPGRPLVYRPYHLQVGGTLMVSAVTVLLTLVVLLVMIPANRWVMSRKIGWTLISIWAVGTAVNLLIEMTGMWTEIPWVAAQPSLKLRSAE